MSEFCLDGEAAIPKFTRNFSEISVHQAKQQTKIVDV